MCRDDDTADAIRYFLRSIGRLPDPNRYVAFEEVGRFKRYTYADEVATLRDGAIERATAKTVEKKAVDTLREEAAHRFESDGFVSDVAYDAIHAVEREGYDEAFWFASEEGERALKEWYDERGTPADRVGLANVAFKYPLYTTPGVDDGDLLLVGKGAAVPPPPGTSPIACPVVVRDPKGIAVIDLDAGFEWVKA